MALISCRAPRIYPIFTEYTPLPFFTTPNISPSPLKYATLPEFTLPTRIILYPLLHHHMRHSHNLPPSQNIPVGIAFHRFRDCSGLRLLMSGRYPRSLALNSSAAKPTAHTYSAGTELSRCPVSAAGPEPYGLRSPYSVWDCVHS